jgi:hypothetical protein
MGRSRNALDLLRKPLSTKGLKSFAIIRSLRACSLSYLFRECDQIFSHAIILLLIVHTLVPACDSEHGSNGLEHCTKLFDSCSTCLLSYCQPKPTGLGTC